MLTQNEAQSLRDHSNANERGQMLPRQGKMGENTPFTGNQPRNPREPLRG